ncbi:MAG: 3-dehydroquinate synthase, partial [Dehalococcoidales bacterium]|nr:3-dehydroquinate synthase [Dehalococcoidales bacterium]
HYCIGLYLGVKWHQMRKVTVNLGQRSYAMHIGEGLLRKTGHWLKERGFSAKAVIITDSTVRPLYGETVFRSLEESGFTAATFEVPAGEGSKTLASAAALYDRLVEFGAERTTPVLALGGGVIGDLAGFTAATYMRGLPLVQLPTTLLAMVDASIGGKTAVDHGKLKNIIGVFHQPAMVIADTLTLKTLPRDEVINGLAEVIKSALIRSRRLFEFLESNTGQITGLEGAALESVIGASARIKAEIVARDEREENLRALLNYGHTVGHAIEAASDFAIRHGQAVAIGMVAEAEIAHRLGSLRTDELERLKNLIRSYGLPVRIPELDADAVMNAMQHDKKVKAAKLRIVLLRTIGSAFLSDGVDPALVREVLFGKT